MLVSKKIISGKQEEGNMNMKMNRSAEAASEQLQALADQEKALVNNVLGAIKSAFSNEPEYSRSVSAIMDRGGEYSHRLMAAVYRHPVAAALSVVGAGCLFLGLRSRQQPEDWSAYHQSRASYGVDPEYIDEWGEPVAAESASGNGVKQAVEEAKERANEAAPQARGYAREVGARAYRGAHTAGDQLQNQSRYLAARASSTVRQHPIATGIIGMALGVAVGGAIYGSSRHKSSQKMLSGRGFSDRDLNRAAAFLNNTSSSARDALRNAKKRITH